jgi:hypothetical protein
LSFDKKSLKKNKKKPSSLSAVGAAIPTGLVFKIAISDHKAPIFTRDIEV